MVRWMFNAANRAGDIMGIGAQFLCERYLQSSHHGDSKVYFVHKEALYVIDLVQMSQRNLSTGRLRQIRRVEEYIMLPKRPTSSSHSPPETCLTVEPGFREGAPFGDILEDNKWRHGIIETDQKQRGFRREHSRKDRGAR